MITVADLRSHTVKDLVAMARKAGVIGAHSMRKEQLVKALAKAARSKQGGSTDPRRRAGGQKAGRGGARSRGATSAKSAGGNGKKGAGCGSSSTSRAPAKSKNSSRGKSKATSSVSQRASDRAARKIRQLQANRERERDLSHASTMSAKNGCEKPQGKLPFQPTSAPGKDRVVLLVRDPYWLQACWDVTRHSVRRAQAALAEHWHTSKPVLRLIEVEAGSTTSTSERIVRQIQVHGGVRNWYIDVKDSPNSYRVELGYLADNGRFYAISRSNVVTTPRPGSIDAIDENWTAIAENYERVYALSGGYEPSTAGGDLQELFEEQLRRPMNTPPGSRSAEDAIQPVLHRDRDFCFEVEAEMIIYGATKPGAQVTLAGEPVQLRHDGTFTVRLSMPDRRQLLPVVACSRDGVEERTIVLSVERNTKVLEPTKRDPHA